MKKIIRGTIYLYVIRYVHEHALWYFNFLRICMEYV